MSHPPRTITQALSFLSCLRLWFVMPIFPRIPLYPFHLCRVSLFLSYLSFLAMYSISPFSVVRNDPTQIKPKISSPLFPLIHYIWHVSQSLQKSLGFHKEKSFESPRNHQSLFQRHLQHLTITSVSQISLTSFSKPGFHVTTKPASHVNILSHCEFTGRAKLHRPSTLFSNVNILLCDSPTFLHITMNFHLTSSITFHSILFPHQHQFFFPCQSQTNIPQPPKPFLTSASKHLPMPIWNFLHVNTRPPIHNNIKPLPCQRRVSLPRSHQIFLSCNHKHTLPRQH